MNTEQSMENWIYPVFWDHILTSTLLKPHAGGHLPYSNFKIGKSDTPTIFKNGSNGKVHQKFISIGLAFLEELANKQTKK